LAIDLAFCLAYKLLNSQGVKQLFEQGETIFDVDGNEYIVSFDGYAELKRNRKIRYALEGNMINCFKKGGD